MGRIVVLCLFSVGLGATPAWAGSCATQIHKAQMAFDARLKAAAEKGPGAAQSTEAKLHRQPTPGSLASAEAQLGDISDEDAHAFGEDMRRARTAAAAGDQAGCKAAVKDARALLAR